MNPRHHVRSRRLVAALALVVLVAVPVAAHAATGTAPPAPPSAAAHPATPPALPRWFVELLRLLFGPRPPHHPGRTTTTTTTTHPPVDCGTWNDTSGWPTTIVRRPNECLLDAFAAGTPGRFVLYSGTNPRGGQFLVTTYEVIGVERVRVTTDPTTATATMGNTITVQECTQLTDEFGFPRPKVDGCTPVSSTPVTAPPTETVIALTPLPGSIEGQPVTFVATVTTADGQPVTEGQVTFVNDYVHSGTAGLDATGHASTTRSLAGGVHQLSAIYQGTTRYRSSESRIIAYPVLSPPTTATTTVTGPTTTFPLP